MIRYHINTFGKPLTDLTGYYPSHSFLQLLSVSKIKTMQLLRIQKKLHCCKKIKLFFFILLNPLFYLLLKINVLWLNYSTQRGFNSLYQFIIPILIILFIYNKNYLSLFLVLVHYLTFLSALIVPIVFSIPFLRDYAVQLLGTDFCLAHIQNSVPGIRQALRIWAPFIFFFLVEEVIRFLEGFYHRFDAQNIVKLAKLNVAQDSAQYFNALSEARKRINQHTIGWVSGIK